MSVFDWVLAGTDLDGFLSPVDGGAGFWEVYFIGFLVAGRLVPTFAVEILAVGFFTSFYPLLDVLIDCCFFGETDLLLAGLAGLLLLALALLVVSSFALLLLLLLF